MSLVKVTEPGGCRPRAQPRGMTSAGIAGRVVHASVGSPSVQRRVRTALLGKAPLCLPTQDWLPWNW